MTNHVFPRPCPNPSDDRVKQAALALLHPGNVTNRDIREAFFDLRDAFHGDAVAAGWHHDISTGLRKDRDLGEMLMLAVSELAEGMEGHRKNRRDDKLPHRLMIEVELADFVIRCFDTIAVPQFGGIAVFHDVTLPQPEKRARTVGHKLLRISGLLVKADNAVAAGSRVAARDAIMHAIFQAFYLASFLMLDLPGALAEKRAYNRTRQDHSVSSRLSAGGKAY